MLMAACSFNSLLLSTELITDREPAAGAWLLTNGKGEIVLRTPSFTELVLTAGFNRSVREISDGESCEFSPEFVDGMRKVAVKVSDPNRLGDTVVALMNWLLECGPEMRAEYLRFNSSCNIGYAGVFAAESSASFANSFFSLFNKMQMLCNASSDKKDDFFINIHKKIAIFGSLIKDTSHDEWKKQSSKMESDLVEYATNFLAFANDPKNYDAMAFLNSKDGRFCSVCCNNRVIRSVDHSASSTEVSDASEDDSPGDGVGHSEPALEYYGLPCEHICYHSACLAGSFKPGEEIKNVVCTLCEKTFRICKP